jgi:hypothetical protein
MDTPNDTNTETNKKYVNALRDNKYKYEKKNVNAVIHLERLKGEKINNISQYNNAVRRQVNQTLT